MQKTKTNDFSPMVKLENVNLWFESSSTFAFLKNKKKKKNKNYHALKNVSFCIGADETVGVIGRNGSGKSTISRLISKVFVPNSGKLEIIGKVQLLALGVGFNNKLTGRDNAYISGSLLGLTNNEIKERIPDIEEFAELGEFFDEPVRTYSSGMRSRLGFAVSTVVEPDILILDEVMSTGDQAFKRKAKKRMDDMRSSTKIVVLVSHNISQVHEMCNRVIWLDKGNMIMDGSPDEVLAHYENFCFSPVEWIGKNPELYSTVDIET